MRVEAARQIGYFSTRDFFVYSDEVDFCEAPPQRRLSHHPLGAPLATVIHHEQLSTDLARAQRRIVEFHRGRDRYLRKHHSAPERWTITVLTALTDLARAVAATALPGHDPARYSPTTRRRAPRAAKACARRRRSTTAAGGSSTSAWDLP